MDGVKDLGNKKNKLVIGISLIGASLSKPHTNFYYEKIAVFMYMCVCVCCIHDTLSTCSTCAYYMCDPAGARTRKRFQRSFIFGREKVDMRALDLHVYVYTQLY